MSQTLLIGLDGATMTVLKPLMDQGIMPFFKSFIEGGARATLMSTPHPLTPPAFVSMTTGRSPGNHGIYDFIRREEQDNQPFFTLFDSRDVRCETVWSIANRQNRKVASLNFVITSPVQPVCGVVVPGMVHWKHLRRHTHPPELYDRLKAQPWFDSKVMCWDFNHLREAIPAGQAVDQLDWIHEHIAREKQWFQVLRFLMKKEPTDLVSIVLDGVDKLQHICWEFLDPAFYPKQKEAWHQQAFDLCHQYFKDLDGYLREVVEIAGSRARTFITSDHGFGPVYTTFRVNQFLHELGLLHWKEGAIAATKDGDEKSLNLDWSRTVAYCPTQSSNGIYIRVQQKPGDQGIPKSEYKAVRQRIADELMKIKEPVKGGKFVKKLLFKEKDFAGAAMNTFPDITLMFFDHGFVSTAAGAPALELKPIVRGTHYPEGVFFAMGEGIKKGVQLDPLSIYDVAPTLLHSLGLPVPKNLEGKVPVAIYEKDYLAENPVEIGEAAREDSGSGGSPDASSGNRTKEEEDVVYEQLRALGYME